MYVFGNALKFLQARRVHSDNYIFRLFYRLTVGIHLAFVGILGWGQYFGSPIHCTPGDAVITNYCWIQGLWTIRKKESVFDPGNTVQPHPGVGVYRAQQHDKVYHRFYQWVPTVLLFFALLFYLPRYLWKKFEDGRMGHICKDMQDQAVSDEEDEKRVKRLVSFYQRPKMNRNNWYVIGLVGCELLNCVAVFVVWTITDSLLAGRFDEYGRYLMTYLRYGMITDGPEAEAAWDVNPMDSVFPKMAKCDFHRIGSSGTKEKVDVMCVLPLNVVNEKIFYFLWCWYILLATLSVANLAYRVVTYFSFPARRQVLLGHLNGVSSCPKKDWENLYAVVRHLSKYGDWYVLTRIKRNVDIGTFSSFIHELKKAEDAKALNAELEPNEKRNANIESEPPQNQARWRSSHFLNDRAANMEKAKATVTDFVKKALTPNGTPRNSPVINRKSRANNGQQLGGHGGHPPPPEVTINDAPLPQRNSPKSQDRRANQQAYKKNPQRSAGKGGTNQQGFDNKGFRNKDEPNNNGEPMRPSRPDETTVNIEPEGDIEMNEAKLIDIDDKTPIVPAP